MITAVRSATFFVAAVTWTVLLALLLLPLPALSRRRVQGGARLWLGGLLWLARIVCGLDWRAFGREHLPAGPAIIAAKHQSAWDVLIFHQIVDDPVFIMKRELFDIPVIGWYMRKAGNIAIDRQARVQALNQVIGAATEALAAGSQIVIFPEGTRVAPDQSRPYQAGVAALYERCAVPVIPVAVNSGLFWGRRHFRKRPGTVTLEILPGIGPGMERRRFLEALRTTIEEACRRLADDAEREFPQVRAAATDEPSQAGAAGRRPPPQL